MKTEMCKGERQWRAEADARMMADYQELINDKPRMNRAIKEAQRQARDLTKRATAMQGVAKTKPASKKK
jgi:hypothetical protein